MTQNVILQGHDLERSVIREVNIVLQNSPHPTHEYTCEVSLKSCCWYFLYGRAIVDRKVAERKNIRETL